MKRTKKANVEFIKRLQDRFEERSRNAQHNWKIQKQEYDQKEKKYESDHLMMRLCEGECSYWRGVIDGLQLALDELEGRNES